MRYKYIIFALLASFNLPYTKFALQGSFNVPYTATHLPEIFPNIMENVNILTFDNVLLLAKQMCNLLYAKSKYEQSGQNTAAINQRIFNIQCYIKLHNIQNSTQPIVDLYDTLILLDTYYNDILLRQLKTEQLAHAGALQAKLTADLAILGDNIMLSEKLIKRISFTFPEFDLQKPIVGPTAAQLQAVAVVDQALAAEKIKRELASSISRTIVGLQAQIAGLRGIAEALESTVDVLNDTMHLGEVLKTALPDRAPYLNERSFIQNSLMLIGPFAGRLNISIPKNQNIINKLETSLVQQQAARAVEMRAKRASSTMKVPVLNLGKHEHDYTIARDVTQKFLALEARFLQAIDTLRDTHTAQAAIPLDAITDPVINSETSTIITLEKAAAESERTAWLDTRILINETIKTHKSALAAFEQDLNKVITP